MKHLLSYVMAALILTAGVATAAERKVLPEPQTSVESTQAGRKIDVNRASLDELLSVPGIGPSVAQGILDLKTKKGTLVRLEDLLDVRGIKGKKLDALRPYLTVAPSQQTSANVKP